VRAVALSSRRTKAHTNGADEETTAKNRARCYFPIAERNSESFSEVISVSHLFSFFQRVPHEERDQRTAR
jgi:hypothetical protein